MGGTGGADGGNGGGGGGGGDGQVEASPHPEQIPLQSFAVADQAAELSALLHSLMELPTKLLLCGARKRKWGCLLSEREGKG